ncbi:MAG: efflux RND transporter periplasmic adaptor subunit, partial [Candidatus Methylumidiphilus sp.]
LALVLGFGMGVGFWLAPKLTQQTASANLQEDKKPLYYRHPMNPKVTSPTPSKDEMGMDYVPVYAEDLIPAAPQNKGRILYYRHPMGAADTSTSPKKDEMGMDYIPVYENEASNQRQVSISPEKIQKLGVKTETAGLRQLANTIRALGSIQVDERRVRVVTAKFEGWVKRLYVNVTGQTVKRGQPLLEIYSPELITAQQEYLIAREGEQLLSASSSQAQATAKQLSQNALQRLRFWDIAPAQLQNLQEQAQAQAQALDTLPLLSPVNGVVLEKPAVEGMRFMPGEMLFRIADLGNVWLLVDVYEQDLDWIKPGQTVSVHVNAYPNRTFKGKISFIHPTLSTETRTVKVRIDLPNAPGLLKPGIYGSVAITAGDGQSERLTVPDSAVIDSGIRQVVLVQLNEGRFEPRVVNLGRKADGYVEVLDGVAKGESVVTSANFLIDAESNLKGALDGLESPKHQKAGQ